MVGLSNVIVIVIVNVFVIVIVNIIVIENICKSSLTYSTGSWQLAPEMLLTPVEKFFVWFWAKFVDQNFKAKISGLKFQRLKFQGKHFRGQNQISRQYK